MKKLIGILLSSLFLVFPICANADILGNVTLQSSYSFPPNGTAYFSYPTGYNDWVLNYYASVNGGPVSDAFCVEGQDLSTSTLPYTLLSIDSSLNTFDLSSSRFLEAAAIADYYNNNYAGNLTYKAGAQMAIWETIYDEDFNFADGAFRSTNAYIDEALLIWDAVILAGIPSSNTTWDLAVNPTIIEGQTVGNSPYQNFLVHHVPEPGILILLGIALSAVGLVARRYRF